MINKNKKIIWIVGIAIFAAVAGFITFEITKQQFERISQEIETSGKNQFSWPTSRVPQLGNLCKGNEECNDYCHKKSLDCEEYCLYNQDNPTCIERYSFVFDYKIDPTLAPGYAKCYPTRGFDNYRTDKTFVIDPENPEIMYVSVEYKGVYKSTDGGKTWKPRNDGIIGSRREDDRNKACHGEYFSITMDPTNSKRLLLLGGAGAGFLNSTWGTGGLYESTNGGEIWHQLAHDWMSAYSLVAVINPEKPSTIYFTTGAFSGTPELDAFSDPNQFLVTKGIVYKTTDNGDTWEELPTGFVPELRGSNLFMDSENPDRLILMGFALKGGSSPNKTLENKQLGMLFTNDGGRRWSQMTSLPEEYHAIGNADVSQNNFNHIFVNSGGAPGSPDKSFYSLDGGKTFTETDMKISSAWYDPHDESGMRLLGYNIFPWEEGGKNILESTDGGAKWHVLGPWPKEVQDEVVPVSGVEIKDPQKVRMSKIVFHPNEIETIYITGNFGYIWKSIDKRKSWTKILSVDELE